jgi:AcrR family transcriptional regulator
MTGGKLTAPALDAFPGETARLAIATRRSLTPNQVAVVDRLVEAAAEDAREHGYEGMTVRSAARRAGVAPATAYTHFSSKDHLLAEVMWRQMADLLAVPPADGEPVQRVVDELRRLGGFMTDDPLVAAAGTTALLAPGADVHAVRLRLGQSIHDRLAAALGDLLDPDLVRSLDLVYTGAVLWMGMGHLDADQVPDALEDAARRLMGERP